LRYIVQKIVRPTGMGDHDYRDLHLYLNIPTIDSALSRFDIIFFQKILSNVDKFDKLFSGSFKDAIAPTEKYKTIYQPYRDE